MKLLSNLMNLKNVTAAMKGKWTVRGVWRKEQKMRVCLRVWRWWRCLPVLVSGGGGGAGRGVCIMSRGGW